MTFNELNSVEHFIIQQLSGVNLNRSETKSQLRETIVPYGYWQYVPPNKLGRESAEVLLEGTLKEALIRLNPSIALDPSYADEVIRKLRSIVLTAHSSGLVRANEEFRKWMIGEQIMPSGKNKKEYVPIRLIDFENLKNNLYQISNQVHIRGGEIKTPDIILYINGLPVVVGEVKTPTRPATSWLDGANEIHCVYEDNIPNLFVPNILSFATEGKEFFYGAVRTPLDYWSPWRLEEQPENEIFNQSMGLKGVGSQVTHLLHPKRLLDILQHFCIYNTNERKQRTKVICRYQQYEGANMIVERVLSSRIKRGLLWHFQGSGKTNLILFAAQKLRRSHALRNPTVIVVVDRIDLDTQISGIFSAADVPNLVKTEDINELHDLLEKDTRKIIITTVYKFQEAYVDMNKRENIILMVDEAHRTQEGDLGRKMRLALPNAFLFGLTGTPINKIDRNTFWAFGAEEDKGGYMSRYTFQDSLRDGATLPLRFESHLPEVHIDKESLDTAFGEMANNQLDNPEKATLSQKAAKMVIFLKSSDRIAKIVKDIVMHYQEKVAPHGFKAMIVTPDREACVLYKEEMDKHLPEEYSAVVISTTANDTSSLKNYDLSPDEEGKLLEKYNKPDSTLKFLIVTAKLLTGFDAPILQTLYLDKSLKDHTLLQAICRTNRLYSQKNFGRIVDYFGVFDHTKRALQFDEETIETIISNLSELQKELPQAIANALGHFEGIDRTIEGFEGLQMAQECINTNEKRDAFAKDYTHLAKLWESLSPDPILAPFERDYVWLTQVYESVKPGGPDSDGKLLWRTLGAQTIKLIHEHVHVQKVHVRQEEMELNEQLVEKLMNTKNPKLVKKIERELIHRFRRNKNNQVFIALSKRLEALREKAERGLINSIDFVKELCQLARETVQAEKTTQPIEEVKSGKAALTELFLELRNADTPAIVEHIVNDIDSIVKRVRFPGWQNTVSGEREVQKSLRRTLLKYKLHREDELFTKAYAYIKEYY